MVPIRLVIVDDHAMFREALQAVLEREKDMVVVGQSGDAASALQLVSRVRADVVLVGLNLPSGSALQLISDIRSSKPSVSIIVVTTLEDDELVSEVIRAGAQGYVLKGVPAADLTHAIRVVAGGGSAIDPMVASHVLNHWRLLTRGQANSNRPDPGER